jgi:hypothetical protein
MPGKPGIFVLRCGYRRIHSYSTSSARLPVMGSLAALFVRRHRDLTQKWKRVFAEMLRELALLESSRRLI